MIALALEFARRHAAPIAICVACALCLALAYCSGGRDVKAKVALEDQKDWTTVSESQADVNAKEAVIEGATGRRSVSIVKDAGDARREVENTLGDGQVALGVRLRAARDRVGRLRDDNARRRDAYIAEVAPSAPVRPGSPPG